MANWSCSTRLCCCCCACWCQSVILKGSCVMQMLWSGFRKIEVGREVCRRMFSKERRKENRAWRNKTRNHTGRSLCIRNYRLSIIMDLWIIHSCLSFLYVCGHLSPKFIKSLTSTLFSLPVFSIWIDVFNEICPRSEKLGCVQFSNSSFVQHTIHHVQHIL